MSTTPTRKISSTTKPVTLSNNAMLYNSVDTYYPSGNDDNSSVRMNKTEELSDFSSQSILCAMDRFVKTVNNMNETVMVPCRLLDVSVESSEKTHKAPPLLRGDNPYNLYNVLNSVKNDLIWGPTSNDDDDNERSNTSPLINNTRWSEPAPLSSGSTTPTTTTVKGHFRRQSTLSTISMSSNASTTSDGESEGGCDVSEGGDSGVDGEESNTHEIDGSSVMDSLRTHLVGLHHCLNNLTDTASYITDRYQEEVNA